MKKVIYTKQDSGINSTGEWIAIEVNDQDMMNLAKGDSCLLKIVFYAIVIIGLFGLMYLICLP